MCNSYIVIGEKGIPLGAVNNETDGWRFIPWTDAHKPSRKGWDTPEAAIPKWVGTHRLEEAPVIR